MVLNSDVYTKQYEEFVKINLKEYNSTGDSDIPIYHFHSIQDVPKEERYSKDYKRAYLPEVASQFNSKEVLLSVNFKGFGINHDGGGFSTDISDTCHWMTPFVIEPEDPFDLRWAPFNLDNNIFVLILGNLRFKLYILAPINCSQEMDFPMDLNYY